MKRSRSIRNAASIFLVAGLSNVAAVGAAAQEPPPTPPGFTATAQGPYSVLLSWTDVDGETEYRVHTAAHALVAALPANTTSFAANGLDENSSYTYHVHAANAIGEGSASNEAGASTPVHQASAADFTVRVVAPNIIAVRVRAPVNGYVGQTGCEIHAAATGQPYGVLKEMSSQYWADQPVTAGVTYFYIFKFRSADGTVNSQWSGALSAATGTLATPTGFAGTAKPTFSIEWTWNRVNGADRYEVLGVNDLPIIPAADTTSFVETGLPENTQVTHKVRAGHAYLVSNPSAALSKYSPAREPSSADLSAAAVSPTQVKVTIAPLVNGAVLQSGAKVEPIVKSGRSGRGGKTKEGAQIVVTRASPGV